MSSYLLPHWLVHFLSLFIPNKKCRHHFREFHDANRFRKFDENYYITKYPDVLKSGMTARIHYIMYGRKEGRFASLQEELSHVAVEFDAEFYLKTYPDIKKAGIDPLEHYLLTGRKEGRCSSLQELQNRVSQSINIFGDIASLNNNKATCIIVSHDATRTGCPILTRDIAIQLRNQYNIVYIILGEGSFLKEIINVADYAILIDAAYKHNEHWLNIAMLSNLPKIDYSFAIVNSIESRHILPVLRSRHIFTLSLIQEVAQYYSYSDFQYTFCNACQVVFSSKLVMDTALRKSNCRHLRFSVIPQGISAKNNAFNKNSTEDNKSFILKLTRLKNLGYKIVLASGLAGSRKGIDFFIKIFIEVSRSIPHEKLAFVWMGEINEEGEFTTFWKGMLEEYQGQNYCEFPGELTEVNSLYCLADLFILPSRLDSLPSVVMEAAYHALPFVCFDNCSGYPEILADYSKYIFSLCVARDYDCYDFANKAAAFLKDRDLSYRIGLKVQQLFKENFTMEDYVNRLLNEIKINKPIFESRCINAKEIAQRNIPSPYCELSSEVTILKMCYNLSRDYSSLKPYPGFHPGIYAEKQNIDFGEALLQGIKEGLHNYIALDGNSLNFQVMQQPNVALHIHAFYPDVFKDICQRLSFNSIQPDLYISTSEENIHECQDILSTFKLTAKDLKCVPNQGRDIGPLITQFGRVLQKYEIVGHIHTKKSIFNTNRNSIQKWYDALLSNLIGFENYKMMDNCISYLQQNPMVGLIYPDEPHIISWGTNLEPAKQLVQQLNIVCSFPHYFNFPAGTMFWGRSNALKKLFNFNLSWNNYPVEPLPIDGTMLHAIERLISFIVKDAGYEEATTYIKGHIR